MVSSNGFIPLRPFSMKKMSNSSKELLESIFLNLVKVLKPDVTNKHYLAQKKKKKKNCFIQLYFLSGELPYVSFFPGKLPFLNQLPLTHITL